MTERVDRVLMVDGLRPVKDDRDMQQRRLLKLPKGDLRLGDGRVLRRIVGYDLSKVAAKDAMGAPVINEATRNGFLASAGWRHGPTGLMVSASIDESERWGPLLHASMSYADHDPTWEEIKWVRAALFPADMDTAMILPRASHFVNVHPHCFHIWQLPQAWGMM